MDTNIGCSFGTEVVHGKTPQAIQSGIKIEAVRLVLERGVTAAQAARDLGINVNVLRN